MSALRHQVVVEPGAPVGVPQHSLHGSQPGSCGRLILRRRLAVTCVGNAVTWRQVGRSQPQHADWICSQGRKKKGECLLTQRPVEGSKSLLGAAQQGVEVSWQDAAGAGVSQGAVVLLVTLCVPAG